LRLLYYSTAYYSNHGGSTHSREFFAQISKRPEVKAFLFPEKGGGGGHQLKPGLRTILRNNPLLQILFFYRRNKFHLDALFRAIEEHKPDAIVMRLDSNFFQIKNIRDRYPNLVIATEVNASPFDESFRNIAFRNHFRQREQQFLSFAHCNFFVSGHLRDQIMGRAMDESRDWVVHNGVDTEMFYPIPDKDVLRDEVQLPQSSIILGYVGTLDVHKKLNNLLSAFAQVLRCHENVCLCIVGDGPDRQSVERYAKELQLENKLIITGWKSHAEIPKYLNCFDVAIHHSAGAYMSPLKMFEYFACRLPLIGPDTPAVRELFVHGDHFLMTDGSSASIASQLSRLLGDENLRRQLAENGYKLIRERYTWKHNASFILEKISKKITG